MLVIATIWMELQGIMLNEINQTEKDKYYMISFISRIKIKWTLGDRESDRWFPEAGVCGFWKVWRGLKTAIFQL